MLRKVIVPTLGLDMESAVIQQWLKQEGDPVAKDEPLLILETDKAATEINSPAGGILRQILHLQGTTVPVTQTIALIETEEVGEAPEEMAPSTRGQDAPLPSFANRPPALAYIPSLEAAGLRASPAARRLAAELGVELSQVTGTGPLGRIQGEDVQFYADERTSTPSTVPAPAMTAASPPPTIPCQLPGRLVPLGRKRRVTAERMALSTRTVASITLNTEVDAAALIALRSRLLPEYQEREGSRLSYNDLLVKAVALALRDHPYLNARWTDQGIHLIEPINVGVAAAVEDGLVVPVVRHADRKSLLEISRELSELLARARADKLSLEEMSGGTFTLTNLGMFGIDSFTPIVNPPESAILGVGRMVERPVGHEGRIVLRPMMTLSLTFDHRVLDGVPAAQFLQQLSQLIQEPECLI